MDTEEIAAAVLQQVKGMMNSSGSGSFIDDVNGFMHAIDWSEPFLKGVHGCFIPLRITPLCYSTFSPHSLAHAWRLLDELNACCSPAQVSLLST